MMIHHHMPDHGSKHTLHLILNDCAGILFHIVSDKHTSPFYSCRMHLPGAITSATITPHEQLRQRPIFYTLWSPACRHFYIGQTTDGPRRFTEYHTRLSSGDNSHSQQPFFPFIHRHGSKAECQWRACHWYLTPIAYAPPRLGDRLDLEWRIIQILQPQLNYPAVTRLLATKDTDSTATTQHHTDNH